MRGLRLEAAQGGADGACPHAERGVHDLDVARVGQVHVRGEPLAQGGDDARGR